MAWAGGAAFAGAIGSLAYFYGIVLAEPAPQVAHAWRHAAIDVALFFLFAAHHSIFARPAVKRWVVTVVPARLERSFYVWIASAMTVGMCVLWQPIPGTVYDVRGWWRVPLWAVQLLGAYLSIRGASVIDPLELAGIHQAAGRSVNGTLKMTGPFRWIRHPIYLGWMLVVFAVPTMTAGRLLFAAISSAYLILAIPWEERSLAAGLGDRYRAYQRLVRWRVLPGVW